HVQHMERACTTTAGHDSTAIAPNLEYAGARTGEWRLKPVSSTCDYERRLLQVDQTKSLKSDVSAVVAAVVEVGIEEPVELVISKGLGGRGLKDVERRREKRIRRYRTGDRRRGTIDSAQKEVVVHKVRGNPILEHENRAPSRSPRSGQAHDRA